jgi:hypothetical protein
MEKNMNTEFYAGGWYRIDNEILTMVSEFYSGLSAQMAKTITEIHVSNMISETYMVYFGHAGTMKALTKRGIIEIMDSRDVRILKPMPNEILMNIVRQEAECGR